MKLSERGMLTILLIVWTIIGCIAIGCIEQSQKIDAERWQAKMIEHEKNL